MLGCEPERQGLRVQRQAEGLAMVRLAHTIRASRGFLICSCLKPPLPLPPLLPRRTCADACSTCRRAIAATTRHEDRWRGLERPPLGFENFLKLRPELACVQLLL